MIFLEVKTTSGHYGQSAIPDTFSIKQSFKVPPPSTIRGFIESLCGMELNTFKGKLSYGIVAPPKGKGNILKLGTYWSNEMFEGKNENTAGQRPVVWETYFDCSYIIGVQDSEFEPLIQSSLNGQTKRFGILSLGTSDDEVYFIKITETPFCRWVRNGNEIVMQIESPNPDPVESFKQRFLKSKKFSIDKSENNEPCWM